MKKKSYAVFGLGKFGYSVASALSESQCEVLVIDKDEELIQEIADKVTYAIKADVTEAGVLESLGISNMDVVIVAIAENMEASIMATIYAKDVGVPYVLTKAMNELHATILKRIGADEVIFPERSMGQRVAKNLLSGGFIDLFELSSSFSMVEFMVPQPWVGRNLKELNVRDRLKVNVIASKTGEEVNVNMDPNEPLKEDQMLIVVGNNEDLSRILNHK